MHCVLKRMNLIVKYFFLADFFFLGGGGHLRLGQIHFPLADMFYVGGQIRLVILHSGKYGNLSLKVSSIKT